MKNSTKVIAIYYPQFHEIDENNLAWGKGFTDWVNVRSARPLHKGHYQPRIPLNDNYYSLTDIEVIRNQVKLAKEHGIDGFTFYHYWFDGKKLLETPLELFLKDKSIDMSFSISWANESWTKRWIGDSKTIIQEQNHTPDKAIWTKHFYYLLPFFKDDRYIRYESKPIFTIYQPNLIQNLSEMLELWQELALKEGLNGICFIATKRHNMLSKGINHFDGILKFQPQEVYNSTDYTERSLFYKYFLSKFRFLPEKVIDFIHYYKQKLEGYKRFDSNKIWEHIHSNAHSLIPDFNGEIYESAYVNWDNTARYNNKATIFSHIEPEEFRSNFSKLYESAILNNKEYVFINAWNEWAEGAYLEPDEKYNDAYLKALKSAIKDTLKKVGSEK